MDLAWVEPLRYRHYPIVSTNISDTTTTTTTTATNNTSTSVSPSVAPSVLATAAPSGSTFVLPFGTADSQYKIIRDRSSRLCLPKSPRYIYLSPARFTGRFPDLAKLPIPWLNCHVLTTKGVEPKDFYIASLDSSLLVSGQQQPIVNVDIAFPDDHGVWTTVTQLGSECQPVPRPGDGVLELSIVTTGGWGSTVDVQVRDGRTGAVVFSCERSTCAPVSWTMYRLYKDLDRNSFYIAIVDIVDRVLVSSSSSATTTTTTTNNPDSLVHDFAVTVRFDQETIVHLTAPKPGVQTVYFNAQQINLVFNQNATNGTLLADEEEEESITYGYRTVGGTRFSGTTTTIMANGIVELHLPRSECLLLDVEYTASLMFQSITAIATTTTTEPLDVDIVSSWSTGFQAEIGNCEPLKTCDNQREFFQVLNNNSMNCTILELEAPLEDIIDAPEPILTIARRDGLNEKIVKLLPGIQNELQFTLDAKDQCYRFALFGSVRTDERLVVRVDGKEISQSQIEPLPESYVFDNGNQPVEGYTWEVGACTCANNNNDETLSLFVIDFQKNAKYWSSPSYVPKYLDNDWFVEDVITGQVVASCGGNAPYGICNMDEWYMYQSHKCLPRNACYRLVTFSINGTASVQASFDGNVFHNRNIALGQSVLFGTTCPINNNDDDDPKVVEIFSAAFIRSTSAPLIPVPYEWTNISVPLHGNDAIFLSQRYNNSLYQYASFEVSSRSCVTIDPFVVRPSPSSYCRISLSNVVYLDRRSSCFETTSSKPMLMGVCDADEVCNRRHESLLEVDIQMSIQESPPYWTIMVDVDADEKKNEGSIHFSSTDLISAVYQSSTLYGTVLCIPRKSCLWLKTSKTSNISGSSDAAVTTTTSAMHYAVYVNGHTRTESPQCMTSRGDVCDYKMTWLVDDGCPLTSAEQKQRKMWISILVFVGLFVGFGIGMLVRRCCCREPE